MIRESLYRMLHTSLDDLGWFNPNRHHLPINFAGKPVDQGAQIELNTISLADEGTTDIETGVGEREIEQRWLYYVDFYAESDSVGREVIHDIRDILAGRHGSVGRTIPHLEIYDYRQATPPLIGYAQIEEVIIDRAHDFPNPWQKHWYACRFYLLDTYSYD